MDKIKVYKDKAGEFRWQRRAPNGRIVSESGEGYTRKDDCLEAVEREATSDEVDIVVEP